MTCETCPFSGCPDCEFTGVYLCRVGLERMASHADGDVCPGCLEKEAQLPLRVGDSKGKSGTLGDSKDPRESCNSPGAWPEPSRRSDEMTVPPRTDRCP